MIDISSVKISEPYKHTEICVEAFDKF